MRIKVAGLWELSWNTPLTESWLWSFPLREFGVTDWAMSPVTGIIHNEKWSGMSLIEYNSVEEMVNEFPQGFTRVFVDEKGEETLDTFKHPDNAAYFFGKAGETPMQFKKEGDMSVRLITVNNTGVMWPHQCLVTVLHDRLMKSGRKSI